MPIEPLPEKLRAFGWHVQEIDGHSHAAIHDALTAARAVPDLPTAIVAHTRKGFLGTDRTLLNGAHTGTLRQDEYLQAAAYLGDIV